MYEATVAFAGAGIAGDADPGALICAIRGGQPVTLRPVIVADVQGAELEDVAPPPSDHSAVPRSDERTPLHDAPPHSTPCPNPGSGFSDTCSPPDTCRAGVAPERARGDQRAASRRATELDGSDAAQQADLAEDRMVDAVAPHPPLAVQLPPLGVDRSLADHDPSPAAEGLPAFTVRCFGSFEVEMDGVPVTNWKVQKARELLAYLILQGGAPVPRERAWEALWPEGEVGQMQRLLSDAAYHLRRTLKEASSTSLEPLTTQGQRYHLRADLFRVDLRSFDAHLDRAAASPPAEALREYERALRLYRGNVFGDEPFEWADEPRRAYEMRMIKAALAAARLADECGDIDRAIGWYRQILAHDPIDEEAAQGLMRCHASLGDRNGVRKVYKILLESLRRELDDPDAKPLPETEALLRQLVEK